MERIISNDVSVYLVNEWNPKLMKFTSNYELKNAYNANETGLIFRKLPAKTLTVKLKKLLPNRKCPREDLWRCYAEICFLNCLVQ